MTDFNFLSAEGFARIKAMHRLQTVLQREGMGEALSAAFSATAVLFVAQAVVDLGKKLSDALAEFIFAKSVWDDNTKSVIDLNNTLMGLQKEYTQLKKQADDYGKSALQLAAEHKGEVKESIEELNKELKTEEDHFKTLSKAGFEHMTMWAAFKQGLSGASGGLQGLIASMSAAYASYKTNNDGAKELGETENKLLTTNQKLKNAHQELRVATNNVSKAQDELNAKGAALQQQMAKTAEELNKLNAAFFATFKDRQAGNLDIITPVQVQNILNGVSAAHNLGVTLKQDLWQALQDAKKAEQEFVASGIQDEVAHAAVSKAVNDARAALENYGKTVDTFKVKSHGLWAEFRDDAKAGATSMDQVKQIGVTAFDDMSKGLEQAIQSAILATSSFGAALEKATASALASIASQAIVKALFYTAEGFAALAGFEETSAAQYFTAAAEMGAVGAAAGLAAHALAGAGGSNNGTNGQQLHGSSSNTSAVGSGRGPTVSVQHFADGGLITAPTLAVMGEQSRQEAVLPLEDPRAMAKIGQAIGENGGTTHHWHIDGVISSDNLAKVVKNISKMVQRNQVNLTASNSLRLTKRSA
jgi:predicted  nucleic acid-binding Zn-ribbon protein